MLSQYLWCDKKYEIIERVARDNERGERNAYFTIKHFYMLNKCMRWMN